MKLLLTSGGITNESIKKVLFELAGKTAGDLKLVFISTAANPEKDKSWLEEDINSFRKLDFETFDVVDISAQPKEVWQSMFNKADILVFGGGNLSYLMEWFEKSGLRSIIPEMLKTKVYVGISAGSMTLTNNFVSSKHIEELYEEKGELNLTKGLGLVDFMVIPHLNSEWFPGVRIEKVREVVRDISDTIYVIDDNTALKINDGKVSVVSEGIWEKIN